MYRLLTAVMLLSLLVLSAAQGANFVKNGDFSRPSALNAQVPADWNVPDGGAWKLAPGAGPQGAGALQYQGDGKAVAAARSACDYIAPTSLCVLKFQYRTAGPLKPVVRILDLGRKQQVARVDLAGADKWTAGELKFRTSTADAGLELYADLAHVDGKDAAAGQVWFAQLTVTVEAGPDTGLAPVPDLGENLALHKPYTMTPGSYGLCTDPGDKTQLTDGVYTQGYFWTQASTVGWGSNSTALVTIDLGQDYPIKGISYNTAAGVAGVTWPRAIRVYTSPDGKSWAEAGDLVQHYLAHSQFPPVGVYTTRKIWSDKLATHGRYVAIAVEPDSSYAFVDEIEVFRGPDSLLQAQAAVAWTGDLKGFLDQRLIDGLITAQMRRELAAVKADIEQLPAYKITGPRLKAEMLSEAIAKMPSQNMEGFKAILPQNDLEREIFKLQASVWREQGKPALRVWTKQRWEMLEPAEEPANSKPPVVSVHMMNNETRSGVINVTNAGEQDATLRLTVADLPGGANPDYVKVYEVLTVGTRRFVAVSAAMPEARRAAGQWLIRVPSGMTRQVWISLSPKNVAPGQYAGKVRLSSTTARVAEVPLNLTVYPLRFPDETTLLVGGWEYTDADECYGIRKTNRDAVISFLQQYYVNAPWGGSSSLPHGKFNSAGQMTEKPDTARFDNWVRQWPKAKMYLIFLAVPDNFDGQKMGTPAFNAMVGEWAKFWAAHMTELGLKPSQLGLLIVDEPNNKSQYDVITAWARAIEAAAPELVTWEDPQPTEDKDCLEMFSAVDVLCPHRAQWLASDPWFSEMFLKQRDAGKKLWFYSAAGPARSFDPYSYYLLQEWHAFQVGAIGSNYWAFGDSGGVNCWNEYPAQGNGPYCPVYLDDTSITTAKWMEAVREGIQDFEYLTMLKTRVAELERKGVPAAKLARAKALLVSGPARVMALEKKDNYRWDETKDRGMQDVVRIEILKALVELTKL